MLRLAVMVLAALGFAIAVALFLWDAASWPMLAVASVFLLGTAYERFYYRGAERPLDPAQWQPTAERFRDEESGRLVTVWFNSGTGERRYIDAGDEI